jgi:Zn-dependent protease
MLMFSLLFHEYSHVYAAISEDLPVEKVVVFALGAGAFIDSKEIFFDQRLGLKVSLAGPIGSFILAILGAFIYLLMPNTITLYFFAINVLFGVFNLLPLFPTDGGRVLYSLLSYKLSPLKAMKVAAIISYVLSGAGALVSAFFGLWWMLVIFIFIIFFAKAQLEGFKKEVLGI